MTTSSTDAPEALDDRVLDFPLGIPGFPGATHWVLTDLVEDGAFQLLQSLDNEELSMVVSVPWLFFPDYAPNLADGEVEALGIESAEDAIVFCSVTVPEGDAPPTMNLLSPFVANRHTRVARQVVLDDDEDRIRTPLPLGA